MYEIVLQFISVWRTIRNVFKCVRQVFFHFTKQAVCWYRGMSVTRATQELITRVAQVRSQHSLLTICQVIFR